MNEKKLVIVTELIGLLAAVGQLDCCIGICRAVFQVSNPEK